MTVLPVPAEAREEEGGDWDHLDLDFEPTGPEVWQRRPAIMTRARGESGRLAG